MEDEDKLPIKRVELSLTKFNEVAIPHHLDLLRQHRANIIKYEQSGEYGRVRAEQAAARRAAARLRALLGELSALRRRVCAGDLPAFDASTQRARDRTLRAVMDYLGVIERSCIAMAQAGRGGRRGEASSGGELEAGGAESGVAGSAASTESVGVVAGAGAGGEDLVQLQIDDQEAEVRSREAVLRGWRELHAELRALHGAWQDVQAAALAQREHVAAAARDTERAAGDVQAARTHLLRAERLRAGALGAGGALLGALAGGPLGLLLGAKAGAAAVLAGSALGYAGARFIGHKRQLRLDGEGPPPAEPDDRKER